MGLQSTQNQYLDGRNIPTCSDQTSAEAVEAVRQILEQCQSDAVSLLEQHRNALEQIAARLLEKENISGAEFMELLNQGMTE